MGYTLDLRGFQPAKVTSLGEDFSGTGGKGETLSFTNYTMERNGRPFFAVSGEFHYSRMNPLRWEDELMKLRMGGVNTVATYLFWNHIEEEEGVFDFSGCRDIRRFVSLCARHGLYVILRVGPFAHGEARNGGLPDWLYGKPFTVRHTNPGFMECVRRLYGEIGRQVQGLFFREGGPVIGIQLDNEYMHASAVWEATTGVSNEWIFTGDEGEAYILALRRLALESGLTPVFFTGTAWGGAAYSPRVLPLWGGYAYRPWIFYSHTGEHPATEEYVYEDYHRNGAVCADDFLPPYPPEERPYACCEMGAGMMCCYNYRFQYPYKSVDALANIKIASGCNFIGYYMFHGGTNPVGKRGGYLNEAQVTKLSYDYQAALGEFGQVRESYRRLKSLHYFTKYFGERLAPMETRLPVGASSINPRDTAALRYAVRTDGRGGFLFLNNFQDHLTLPPRRGEEVTLQTAEGDLRYTVSLAPEENAILPFNLDLGGILLRQAHAQPVLQTRIDGRLLAVFLIPEGMEGSFLFEDGVTLSGGTKTPSGAYSLPGSPEAVLLTAEKDGCCCDLLVLSREKANQLYILRNGSLVFTPEALLEDAEGGLRLETLHAENTLYAYPPAGLAATGAVCMGQEGPLGAYRADTAERHIPVTVANPAPLRYVLRLPENTLEGLKDARLSIRYEGDIGCLFRGNTMISDNFCNGAPWEIGLLEQREGLGQPLVLTIAPLKEGATVRVDSPMAARSEAVATAHAGLTDVRVQPVYEISL